jgi:hypothetical protein
LDFLGLSDRFLERDLGSDSAGVGNLSSGVGAGFSFVARQKRIQLDGNDFYIDLLFYNRKLKRLVVVELKQGAFKPEYKGQRELYLRWLARYETEAGEETPLGIILCAGKNTEQIEKNRSSFMPTCHPTHRQESRSIWSPSAFHYDWKRFLVRARS